MTSLSIIINGAPIEVAAPQSVASLLINLGKNPEHVAVEHNGVLLESTDFDTTLITDHDRLEIVHFVGGG